MNLQDLPAVDLLLSRNPHLIHLFGRNSTLMAVRSVLDEIRQNSERLDSTPSLEEISQLAHNKLTEWVRPSLTTVINATGVVLHTNLGRAPLSLKTVLAMGAVAKGYSNLEFDLTTGKRGSRSSHTEDLFIRLTGTEAAFVVNNCASAVLLALTALAKGKGVIIPRSQLIEIGGGFRIPDVMKQSGAKLLEVGTTNKVRVSDFTDLLAGPGAPARMILMRAHRSNFKLIGFTEEPTLAEMIDLAHKHGTILIDDLGSGAMLDTSKYGMEHESMVQESVNAGADLILFSGDKLLGGPQAGIILGKEELIDKIKKHPLARAVRADKTCLAGLEATLLHYLKDEAESEIPIWRMISQEAELIRSRALTLREKLGIGEVIEGFSTVGGGSLPGEVLPTWLLSFKLQNLQQKLKKLREFSPPVIARIEKDRLVVDLRTVFEQEMDFLSTALLQII